MFKKLLVVLLVVLNCSAALAAHNSYTKSKLPLEKKKEIYTFYTRAENAYDLDTAYQKTAKRFKISQGEVIRIKTEGAMEDWLSICNYSA